MAAAQAKASWKVVFDKVNPNLSEKDFLVAFKYLTSEAVGLEDPSALENAEEGELFLEELNPPSKPIIRGAIRAVLKEVKSRKQAPRALRKRSSVDSEFEAPRTKQFKETKVVPTHPAIFKHMKDDTIIAKDLEDVRSKLDNDLDVVFIGNPGTGKSFLASSISGAHFESGVSWGHGKTSELLWQSSPHLKKVRFADTPGLADMTLKEQASAAITSALRQSADRKRPLKIIFVVNCPSGRYDAGTLVTFNDVMASVRLADDKPAPPNSFGVLVNKCDFMHQPDFVDKGMPGMQSQIDMHCPIPTDSCNVRFIPEVEDCKSANNKRAHFSGLLEWVLQQAPSMLVVKAEKIDVRDYQTRVKEMQQLERRKYEEWKRQVDMRHKADRILAEMVSGMKGLSDQAWAYRQKKNDRRNENADVAARNNYHDAYHIQHHVPYSEVLGHLREREAHTGYWRAWFDGKGGKKNSYAAHVHKDANHNYRAAIDKYKALGY